MTQEFICTADGKEFSTEEEALHYMIHTYIEEVVREDGLEEVKQQLEKELPGFTFELTKRPYTFDDTRWITEEEFVEGKDITFVTVTSDRYEMPYFNFSIVSQLESDEEQNEFKTLEDALLFYKRFLFGAETFAHALRNEIARYDDTLSNCIITKITQTYGTADSFNEYHYEFHDKNGKIMGKGYMELNTHDLSSDERLHQEIEKYCKRVTAKYIDCIEGYVSIGRPKYGNDHRSWFEIDGFSVNAILARGKEVQIEILEEK